MPAPADRTDPASAVPAGGTAARTPRRVQIATQAAQVFAERSYHAVGMREVAAAVGIRGASLYNHFSSKEEILYEIALSVTRDSVEGWISILDAPGRPAERLAALVRSHLHLVAVRRVEHLVSVRELRNLDDEHRRHVLDYRTYYHRRVRDLVVAGERAGDFRTGNPRLATTALLDMLNGVSAWYRPEMDVDQLADDYTRLGIGGLLGHPGDPEELCRAAVALLDSAGIELLEPVAATPAAATTQES